MYRVVYISVWISVFWVFVLWYNNQQVYLGLFRFISISRFRALLKVWNPTTLLNYDIFNAFKVFKGTVVVNSSEHSFFLKRYPWNIYLVNNEEDIVVFLNLFDSDLTYIVFLQQKCTSQYCEKPQLKIINF